LSEGGAEDKELNEEKVMSRYASTIQNAPGVEFLTEKEKEFCIAALILPYNYLSIKQEMLRYVAFVLFFPFHTLIIYYSLSFYIEKLN
jgi:hypothetical protein